MCTKCHEIHDSIVTLNVGKIIEMDRSTANLVMRCKFCKSQGTVDILKDSLRPYTVDDSPEFKPLINLEARNWEPTECILGEGWKAQGVESNTIFEDFSLEDLEWADYDDVSGSPVEIFGVETKIIRI